MNLDDDLEPDWLLRARREIGIKEKVGPADHPRILQYFAETKIAPAMHHDSVPWCSAFACWVMEQSGIRSTRSAAARSWLTWGKPLDKPQKGCIVVFERKSADNPNAAHVAFYVGEAEDGSILVLGGNQANQVCIRPYAKDRLIGYRWPML